MKIDAVQAELREFADPAIAKHSLRFFKTGKGEYGEGDKFLGVRVPTIRAVAKNHRDLPLKNTLAVLKSSYHEERLLALVMMVYQFEKGGATARREIYHSYLKHTKYVSGWDLVDSSAHQIVGGYLLDRSRGKLTTLSKSSCQWERRISIIATLHFIKHEQFDDTLNIARQLLHDEEDLIHKAVGWMLREVGKRHKPTEVEFLAEYYKIMPRTMLRYAIEKFEKAERDRYLRGYV